MHDRDPIPSDELPMLLEERLDERTGVGSVRIEHFLLHPALVGRLRLDGLSVATGTVNDATLAARAAALASTRSAGRS